MALWENIVSTCCLNSTGFESFSIWTYWWKIFVLSIFLVSNLKLAVSRVDNMVTNSTFSACRIVCKYNCDDAAKSLIKYESKCVYYYLLKLKRKIFAHLSMCTFIDSFGGKTVMLWSWWSHL